MATLAYTALTEGRRAPERWVLFLHGLLGRGGNWRSFGRRWVETHPSWGAALVDLRLHGESRAGFPPPHTVRAAAEDVLALTPALPGPVEALVGHSLGGKVAARRTARERPALLARGGARRVSLGAPRRARLGAEPRRARVARAAPRRVRHPRRVRRRRGGRRAAPRHRPVAGHGAGAGWPWISAFARFTGPGVTLPAACSPRTTGTW